MSPRKFLKNLSILSVFALILTIIGYGTFVYAGKYTWTSLSSPTTDWQAVAMANYTYGYAGRLDQIYSTNNGGSTWNHQYSFGSQYSIRSIATSENGLYVLVSYDDINGAGGFAVSSNYGSTYSYLAPSPAEFYGVAMSGGGPSGSGQYMYVADGSNSRVYYSNNHGSSWNYTYVGYSPYAVTTSNDGMYVYVATNSYALKSSDYGINYTTVYYAAWVDVATSANGQYVYAVPSYGYPLYSSDYGVTFTELTSAAQRNWKSVSVSGDGSRVVLVEDNGSNGSIFSSRDYGTNFTIESQVGISRWNDVSLSADGNTTLLASSDNYIWTGNYVAPPITSGAPDLYYGSDTGISDSDDITNIANLLNFTGSCTNGNTVQLYFYSVLTGNGLTGNSTTCSSSSFSLTSGSLPEETYSMTFKETDGLGNESEASASSTLTIDTTAPTTSGAPDMADATDSGVSHLDNITKDTTPDFTGSCTDGNIVQLFDDGNTSGSSATCSSSAFSLTTGTLTDGTHSITYRETDVAGNESTDSSSISITIDTTAPIANYSLNMQSGSDTGISDTDHITSSTTLSFSGLCADENILQLFDDGNVSGSPAACVTYNVFGSNFNSFSVTTGTLTDGTHSITYRETDVAGNESTDSSSISITIDTTAPTTPGSAPDMTSGTDLGASSTDNITNDTTPDFTGSCTNGNTVFLASNHEGPLGSLTCSGTSFTRTASTMQGGVTHLVSYSERDLAGNQSSYSPTLSVTIDTTAPTTSGAPDLISDSGVSSTDNITSGPNQVFTGSCTNGNTVQLFDDGVASGNAETCELAAFSLDSGTLASGSNVITFKETDVAGNVSSASVPLSITIDTTAPTISSVSSEKDNGSYTVGEVIDIDVTFSEVVQSSGNITVTLETGTTDRTCTFSVSNSATGTCNYTVQAGDTTGDLTVSSISGTIRDIAGNSLTNFVPATNLAANKALIIDTTEPSSATTTPSSDPIQSSGPTAYSSAPTSAIPGIYNPAGNNGTGGVTSPTKVIASAIIQSAGINSNFNFTQNATVRSINNEVINIQRMLNTMGYTVATTGVGSKGNESTFFGQRSRLALIRFQRAFAIPATGFFGPLSRAAMNRILNSIR